MPSTACCLQLVVSNLFVHGLLPSCFPRALVTYVPAPCVSMRQRNGCSAGGACNQRTLWETIPWPYVDEVRPIIAEVHPPYLNGRSGGGPLPYCTMTLIPHTNVVISFDLGEVRAMAIAPKL